MTGFRLSEGGRVRRGEPVPFTWNGTRMAGMAGLWPVTPYENTRMVSEKAYAITKAMGNVAQASLRGAAPEAVMAAAIKPVRQKTRSNARRLTKRGLKKR